MSEIALNFFPVKTDEFIFKLYLMPYIEDSRPKIGEEDAVRRYIKVDEFDGLYWTLFQSKSGSSEVLCRPYDNTYATIDALRIALFESCKKNLDDNMYRFLGGYRRRLEIITGTFTEGLQVVTLEPYYLRSQKKYGFLADFRFHPDDAHHGTIRSLKLSLSLDRHGHPNLNYYADRYSYLVNFVGSFHDRLFPIEMPNGSKVEVESHLLKIHPEILDRKTYVVGNNIDSQSQFRGMKESGPLRSVSDDTRLYFVYRREDHGLSQDLFRAIRGDTYSTFPGMEEMFSLPLSKENISGVVMTEFSTSEIMNVRDRIVSDAGGRSVVPIVLTPFSRYDEPGNNAAYWSLKHAFLSYGLPIQVVSTDTVADRNKLKWASASIGLQVFAKLGGTPWKVRPRIEKCLIVGIGQAHRKVEHSIERFFAYSVLSDSSGVFEEVRVLGEDRDEETYMENFGINLRRIFEDYSDRFSSFVVHATFALRRRELECIASALASQKKKTDTGEFVSLKFNERNRFFGYSASHNSRVPYESSVLPLSHTEFLVWLEGLQYGQSTLHKMVGNPLHVKFTFPHEHLSWNNKQLHLQDAINLSGANWRGFNAKSLPVSVYYAQLIASYLKEFEKQKLDKLDVNILKPWFL